MPSPHPTNQPEGPDRPTPRQLRYLRALANRRGQTFTYPLTKAKASAEIRRLQAIPAESHGERWVERERLQREVELPADATAVGDEEITGHGASARWTHTREPRS
jgi:hypothetical protein